jgi:predicted nucleotide-binding protein
VPSRSSSPSEDLPTVFIGSSSEGIEIADDLQSALHSRGSCDAITWRQGIFELSDLTMESLLKTAHRSDFAVLITTADDTADVRAKSRVVARDNVIFELGLFIVVLGRERTYIIVDRDDDLQVPSDKPPAPTDSGALRKRGRYGHSCLSEATTA